MNQPNSGVSRQEFLRQAMVGTSAGALACLASTDADAANRHADHGFVIAITHGAEDAARVMLALVTASRMPAGDNHVWFAIHGGPLCKKGEAEKVTSPLFAKQGNAAKLLALIRASGTAVHI